MTDKRHWFFRVFAKDAAEKCFSVLGERRLSLLLKHPIGWNCNIEVRQNYKHFRATGRNLDQEIISQIGIPA